jgi:hypothetical protein
MTLKIRCRFHDVPLQPDSDTAEFLVPTEIPGRWEVDLSKFACPKMMSYDSGLDMWVLEDCTHDWEVEVL